MIVQGRRKNYRNSFVATAIIASTDFTSERRELGCAANADTVGYLEKLEFWFEIKACEEFYRRHITDIPRIKF